MVAIPILISFASPPTPWIGARGDRMLGLKHEDTSNRPALGKELLPRNGRLFTTYFLKNQKIPDMTTYSKCH